MKNYSPHHIFLSKPWNKSTGPKSDQGKLRASQNARKRFWTDEGLQVLDHRLLKYLNSSKRSVKTGNIKNLINTAAAMRKDRSRLNYDLKEWELMYKNKIITKKTYLTQKIKMEKFLSFLEEIISINENAISLTSLMLTN